MASPTVAPDSSRSIASKPAMPVRRRTSGGVGTSVDAADLHGSLVDAHASSRAEKERGPSAASIPKHDRDGREGGRVERAKHGATGAADGCAEDFEMRHDDEVGGGLVRVRVLACEGAWRGCCVGKGCSHGVSLLGVLTSQYSAKTANLFPAERHDRRA